ncbi:MAG: class I tRNA ligase family protein, partial [Luteimonas sp.]|nr:class I tRNA ligase family protein [Luteimonas sp.]
SITEKALEVVRSGEIRFYPENWVNTYNQWLNNIQDWCISRQLWWGHRIPAWYDDAGNVFVGRTKEEAEAKRRAQLAALGAANGAVSEASDSAASCALRQDSDVLETWFSSALWPFSTLGWPDADAMRERGFDKFLPTSVLVTGFDIIFFWVARMVMMTDALTGKVAFDDVYITGLVRDKDGQKMSKSKGNIIDPLDLIDGITADALVAKRTTGLMKPKDAPKIEKATRKEFPDGIAAHGADPLRFTMAALAGPGRDIKFDLGRAEGYKNFCNKLWNATRFVLMNTEGASLPPLAGEGVRGADGGNAVQPRTDAEKWILSRLARTAAEAEAHFAAYRFDLLAQTLYEFAWNEFCDWFVELAKPALQGVDAEAADSTRRTLLSVLEALLRLLHPLVPFVTEELWRHVAPRLGIEGNTISLQRYPQAADFAGDFGQAEADIEWLRQMVTALRRIRSELGVSPSRQVPLLVQSGSAADHDRLRRFDAQLKFLNRLGRIEAIEGEPPPAAAGLVGDLKLFVPLEGLVDLGAERARLDREIARVSAEKGKSESKLAKFSDKVPPAVVEQERQRLAEWTAQLDALAAQRARLS